MKPEITVTHSPTLLLCFVWLKILRHFIFLISHQRDGRDFPQIEVECSETTPCAAETIITLCIIVIRGPLSSTTSTILDGRVRWRHCFPPAQDRLPERHPKFEDCWDLLVNRIPQSYWLARGALSKLSKRNFGNNGFLWRF